MSDPREALAAAPLPIRRCLELAHDALRAGGLACGSVLVDGDGQVLSEGRNHAYDPPSGGDVLEGTPIAHAEINVLARVPTGRDLSGTTLWSSQEPCSMCTAAAVFVGVGAISWIAPDPWALATDRSRTQGTIAAVSDELHESGPADEPWRTIANALFILSIAATRGVDHSTVVQSRSLDPDAADTALALLEVRSRWPDDLAGLLALEWSRLDRRR